MGHHKFPEPDFLVQHKKLPTVTHSLLLVFWSECWPEDNRPSVRTSGVEIIGQRDDGGMRHTSAAPVRGVAHSEWNPFEVGQTEPDRLCLNQEEERRGQKKKKTHRVLCFFEETDATNKAHTKCDRSLELRGGVDIGGISIQTRPFDFCDRVGAH